MSGDPAETTTDKLEITADTVTALPEADPAGEAVAVEPVAVEAITLSTEAETITEAAITDVAVDTVDAAVTDAELSDEADTEAAPPDDEALIAETAPDEDMVVDEVTALDEATAFDEEIVLDEEIAVDETTVVEEFVDETEIEVETISEDLSVEDTSSEEALMDTTAYVSETASSNGLNGTDAPTTAAEPAFSNATVAAVMHSLMNPEQYTLTPKGTWPPPIFVNPNAGELERHYIEFRWHAQWDWYDRKASEAKTQHQRLQRITVIGSTVITALVAFTPPVNVTNAIPWLEDVLKVVTVVISLAVGLSAGFEGLYKHGDNWRNYRGAAEEMLREKSMYDVKSGPYRKTKVPFQLFVQRIEEIITKQNGTFLQLADDVQQQGQQGQQGQNQPRQSDEYTSVP